MMIKAEKVNTSKSYCPAMNEPILNLSLYFKAHRQEYYDWLEKV